jgi:CheY-like chemotaxis protein
VTAAPLSGRSILVVEDEALVALDIGDALKQRGAQVIVTSSV